MQALFDLLPVAAFFVAYKLAGIYIATAVLLVATIVQVAIQWLRTRRVSQMLLISAGVALLFGGATLLIHDDRFIVWKPTVVYALFALGLLASQWFSDKPFVQRLLEAQLRTDARTWQIANTAWALFFLAMAGVNLVFVYGFSRDAWVNWHTAAVFVVLAFALAQGAWLARRADAPAAGAEGR
jgi:intracellular septation protein